VFLGYPLVPMGRTEPRDVSHLGALGPLLFVQGERDALAPLPAIRAVVAGIPSATLEVIAEADHGFRVPRRTGVTPEQVLDRLAAVVIGWIRVQSG
jgi:predicted alpha/beta-hydrolase family hydrolase